MARRELGAGRFGQRDARPPELLLRCGRGNLPEEEEGREGGGRAEAHGFSRVEAAGRPTPFSPVAVPAGSYTPRAMREPWRIHRADGFPSETGGGNRALCCTTTCCLIFIATGIGIAAGGLAGLVSGIKADIRIHRADPEARPSRLLQGTGGLAAGSVALGILAAAGVFMDGPVLALPFAIAALAAWLGPRSVRAGNGLAVLGRACLHGALFALLGGLVGLGIGLLLQSLGIG